MGYTMRFRVAVFLVGQGAAEEAAANDPVVINVGSYADPVPAGEVAITSLTQATSGAASLVRRLQSGFYQNARAVIYGQPVGAPEAGQDDISEDVKAEKVYVTLDTPNPKLVYEMRRANRKPPAENNAVNFVPLDPTPEVAGLPAADAPG